MNRDRSEKFLVVETRAALRNLAATLENESVVACDLEADSMFHYKEKVCLLQIATKKLTVVIDPLAVKDLSTLAPLFSNPAVQKVFHGADYDVRSLFRDFGIVINNLFDTELACRFLGIRSTGLESVIHKMFDVRLNKKYQKRDWSQRPLPEAMLRYAAGDTIYLLELSELLTQRLEDLNRLFWVKEECDLLSKVRPTPENNRPLFMKFKGAGRLSRRNLAVLEALLEFRQDQAKKKDRPLFKIIGNQAIMKIVSTKPMDVAGLKKANLLSNKQIRMYGKRIVRIVRQAMDIPTQDLPVYPRNKPPDVHPAVPIRIKLLKAWRDGRAKNLRINPPLLFSKSQLTAIALANPTSVGKLDAVPEMRQWQKSVFGKEIVGVIKANR